MYVTFEVVTENKFTDEQMQSAKKGLLIGLALGLGTGLIMDSLIWGIGIGLVFSLAIGGGLILAKNEGQTE